MYLNFVFILYVQYVVGRNYILETKHSVPSVYFLFYDSKPFEESADLRCN